MTRRLKILVQVCAWFAGASCATPGSPPPNESNYWDEPQPECFFPDAVKAGSRIGTEGMPPEAGESGHFDGAAKANMSKLEVSKVVDAHIDEVRHCYSRALANDSKLHGHIVVRFTVGAHGKVVASAIESSTVADDSVEFCVGRAVCRWLFEAPTGRGTVAVTYPFEFEPHAASP